ncbi:MAG: hypothetical protein ACLQU3_20710 [Limisphaerales bacterium]
MTRIAQELKYNLVFWSVVDGLVDTQKGTNNSANDPLEALIAIRDLKEKTLILLRDFHLFLADPNPILIRQLKDVLQMAKTKSKTLIILGCRMVLPPELERELTMIEFALPGNATSAVACTLITMSEAMKQAFGLVRRPWGVFYLKHKITGEQKSLKTSDKCEAQRILQAHNESECQPHFNLSLARVYLNGADPKLTKTGCTRLPKTLQNSGGTSANGAGIRWQPWQRQIEVLVGNTFLDRKMEKLIKPLKVGIRRLAACCFKAFVEKRLSVYMSEWQNRKISQAARNGVC